METLDIQTMEQIRNIVVEAANAKVPLQRERKLKVKRAQTRCKA